MLTLDLFDYHLPEELIAQHPAEPRDHSRLLVLDPKTGQIDHQHFYDLVDLLGPNDVLVRNNTKVIPARIFAKKETGGQIEILLLKQKTIDAHSQTWECLTKPTVKLGQKLTFTDVSMTVEVQALDGYIRVMKFDLGGSDFWAALDQIGKTPLPPVHRVAR